MIVSFISSCKKENIKEIEIPLLENVLMDGGDDEGNLPPIPGDISPDDTIKVNTVV